MGELLLNVLIVAERLRILAGDNIPGKRRNKFFRPGRGGGIVHPVDPVHSVLFFVFPCAVGSSTSIVGALILLACRVVARSA